MADCALHYASKGITSLEEVVRVAGGVIDEEALLAALDSGKVAAAALDVFASEPPALGGIATHSQIVATPHIGAQSAEAQVRAGVSVAEEVLAALTGKSLRWQVLSNA